LALFKNKLNAKTIIKVGYIQLSLNAKDVVDGFTEPKNMVSSGIFKIQTVNFSPN
jgi:hypothetical protein